MYIRKRNETKNTQNKTISRTRYIKKIKNPKIYRVYRAEFLM